MQPATDAEAAMIGYVQKEKSQMDYRKGAVEWSRQTKECRKKILFGLRKSRVLQIGFSKGVFGVQGVHWGSTPTKGNERSYTRPREKFKCDRGLTKLQATQWLFWSKLCPSNLSLTRLK